MTTEMKKDFIKAQGKTHLVKELVLGIEIPVKDAVDYVYDHLTLTKEEFKTKYLTKIHQK